MIVTERLARLVSPDGEVEVYLEYDDVTTEVANLVYTNTSSRDAFLSIQKIGRSKIDVVLSKGSAGQKFLVALERYAVETRGGFLNLKSDVWATISFPGSDTVVAEG